MQAVEKPELSETRQKTFSVLLIDDDADVLTIFKYSLAQAGMHTYGFTNPALAVEHFRRNANNYDIVVTDIRMPPHMSGFQVARAVKQIRPDIKVAFTTPFGINKSEFDKIFPSTEADAFITKPVMPSMSTDVSSVLQHTLQGWCYKV
jgi:CheY-like chemotaxis protein